MPTDTNNAVDLTAIAPADLATLLSNTYRRQITEEQVRMIAEDGNLLSASDRINLIHYTAYLADAVSHGKS